MNQQVTTVFDVPNNIECYTQQLSVCEVLDMWPNLITLFNSPWENVREILMLVILNCFKQGFYYLSNGLKQKAYECLKQLLSNFLQSNDFSERLMGIKLLAVLMGLGR